MADLNSKTGAIIVIVFACATVVLNFVPQFLPTKVVVDCLFAFTAVLYYGTREKKGIWAVFNWIWVAFALPYLSAGLFLVSFLTLVSPETLVTWGLAIYLSLVPIVTFVMFRWLKVVLNKLF